MKYMVYSLGCKVNSYECSAISSLLNSAGYIEDSSNPDVVIINTCSVTSTADQKSRQHIRKFKKLYPDAIIIVMGCYSQGNAEFIFNEIKPTIVLGTKYRNDILDLINEYKSTGKPILKIDDNPRKFNYEELGVTSCSENTRAYLKIQDGCNNFCTYCIIPYRRGKMRSRNKFEILKEANYLVETGHKEIVLSGIHVGGYGQDLESESFSKLVSELLDVKGLDSLRISSIEESEIDDELISIINERGNIAHHLHIPLQSGSNKILKIMNRKYDQSQFINKIEKIRNALPDVAISTDVIVGFPGETEEDFIETYKTCEKCFDMIHVFPFSPRTGTPAAKMKEQIPSNIKAERVNRLIELSNSLWKKFSKRFIDTKVTVLVEQFDEKNSINIGHTSNYIEVKIPSSSSKVGEFVEVVLKEDMIISK